MTNWTERVRSQEWLSLTLSWWGKWWQSAWESGIGTEGAEFRQKDDGFVFWHSCGFVSYGCANETPTRQTDIWSWALSSEEDMTRRWKLMISHQRFDCYRNENKISQEKSKELRIKKCETGCKNSESINLKFRGSQTFFFFSWMFLKVQLVHGKNQTEMRSSHLVLMSNYWNL